MTQPVTVIAPIERAAGKSEADLVAASQLFQQEFVDHEPGMLRRELVRKSDGTYLDIVQFRSAQDTNDVIEKEQNAPACHSFFSVMDMSEKDEADIELMPSLGIYLRANPS